jgi:hypothetical protein
MLTSNGWKIDVMPPGMIVRSVLELFSTTWHCLSGNTGKHLAQAYF